MFADDILFQQRFLTGLGLYDGELDGLFGPKTAAGLSKFEAISDEIAEREPDFVEFGACGARESKEVVDQSAHFL